METENTPTEEDTRLELLTSIAQLWDDASRETNPVLQQGLIDAAQEKYDALPTDQDRAEVDKLTRELMGH